MAFRCERSGESGNTVFFRITLLRQNGRPLTIGNNLTYWNDAERVVNQRARIVYYGYPDRYLEDYRANIAKVTQADVLRVARRYLHPEKLIKVVVGDAAGFDRPLSAFGAVREIRPEVWN